MSLQRETNSRASSKSRVGNPFSPVMVELWAPLAAAAIALNEAPIEDARAIHWLVAGLLASLIGWNLVRHRRPFQQRSPETRLVKRRTTALYSVFSDDPDISALLPDFVSELRQRAWQLRSALAANDRIRLEHVVHKMAGSSGSYGFGEVTVAARSVEQALQKRAGGKHLDLQVKALLEVCARVDLRSVPAPRSDSP